MKERPFEEQIGARVIEAGAPWVPDGDDENSPHILLSTDVLIRRNVEGVPFIPEETDTGAAKNVLTRLEATLKHINKQQKQDGKPLFHFKCNEKNVNATDAVCMESHGIPARKFFPVQYPHVMYATKDFRSLLYFNNDNHYTLILRKNGVDARALTQEALRITNAFESEIPFLKAPHYGYVTRQISSLGSGWRASSIVHLPGLILAGHRKHVENFLEEQNVHVKFLSNENKDMTHFLATCEINGYPGTDPEEQAVKMERILKQLEQHELDARAKLSKGDEALRLNNAVRRTCAVIKNALFMDASELLHSLSILWLGHELKLLTLPVSSSLFFHTFFHAYMNFYLERNNIVKPSTSADCERIRFVREVFELEPDF